MPNKRTNNMTPPASPKKTTKPNMKYSTDYKPELVTFFGRKEEAEARQEPNMKYSHDYHPEVVSC